LIELLHAKFCVEGNELWMVSTEKFPEKVGRPWIMFGEAYKIIQEMPDFSSA
jgi:hypothetical protein